MLIRYFKLSENNTNLRTEILAGCSTFLTMSYIIFVNPSLLSLTGMDKGSVFVATCLAASIGSFLMGVMANYPIALAPGMGLNAYFVYSVVLTSGYKWQTALGAVFISGCLFLFLSLSSWRQFIVDVIPKTLKIAIVSGIGFFLCIIGFKNAGLVQGNPGTLITLGNLHAVTTWYAIAGFFLIVALEAMQVIGAVIISILVVTVVSVMTGVITLHGFFAPPPSILPTLFQCDIKSAFNLGLITIVLAFFMVDLFDNTGTLIGIGYQAKLLNKAGQIPRLKYALIADSIAAIVGALLGTSTTTNFVESTVGVKAGGRTGLTAVTISILFLCALFFSPFAAAIPLYATAPALIYVACLMSRSLADIDWTDITEYVPAIITTVTMPFTFSIATGIGFGFITYVVVKILSRRHQELNWTMVVLALIFIYRFSL